MKKLFALMLTVAMVASLFVGVAFAADIEGKINLGVKSAVLSGDTYGTFQISGTITTTAGALINESFILQMNGKDYAVTNGKFSFLIETNVAAPVTYAVTTVAKTGFNIAATNFSLVYNVTLSKALEYNYSGTAQEVITGTVKYADGSIPQNKTVGLYWLDGVNIGSAIVENVAVNNSTGSFGFIVNGWGSKAGKIALVSNNVIHAQGEVKPLTMAVTATPNNVVHTVATSAIKLAVSNGPTTGTLAVTAKLYKGTEEVTTGFTLPGGTLAAGKVDLTLTSAFAVANSMGAGTYKVVVTTTDGLYAGSATFTVVAPSKITLIDPAQKLKEFVVGGNTMTFGPGHIEIIETNSAGGVVSDSVFVYTVYVNGEKVLNQNIGAVPYVAAGLETVAVRVVAQRKVGDAITTTVYDNTFNVSVVGWNAAYTVKSMTVGQKSTVTFVITDKDGNLVNNANVVLTHPTLGSKSVSPLTANIQNGTYQFVDLAYTAIGDVKVEVYTLGETPELRAEIAKGISVLGEKVYTVTSNVAEVLLGKKQVVTLTVSDVNGAFIPEALTMYVDGAASTPTFTPVDTDNDGLADSIKVEVTATSLKTTFFRAHTQDSKKMGEVTLGVVAPLLVAEGNLNLTENIETKLTFKVVDPRTNTVLTEEINFVPGTYVGSLGTKDDQGRDLIGTVSGEETYTVFATASVIGWEAAKTAEKSVVVALEIELDAKVTVAGTFPVAKATLTSNPATVLIGMPNNMTLTYTDANGQPIVGKDVYLGEDADGALIGETNEAGQVFYALAQGTTTAVKFAAETDVAAFTTLTVTAGFDGAAPVVTAPATVEGTTATITVKDNVRVSRLMVNGVEISIFPTAEVKHVVTVKPGVNTFAVVAMDSNYNVVETTVTINSSAFTPVVITIGKANPSIGLDQPAVAKNGRLMLPFRWFGEQILGATVSYEVVGGAEIVTLHKGDTHVELTLNGMVAKVNGAPIALDVAAYATGGRTLVPARFLAETFGFNIAWDAATNNVTISK